MTYRTSFPTLWSIAIGAAMAVALGGCGGGSGNNSSAAAGGGGGGPGAHGPTQVGYVVVQPTEVPTETVLAARTSAFQTAEVRPQVSGLIRRRFFTEGSIVHEGQALYQVDPRLYRADANQAQANLSSAQANAEATRIRAQRYRPLAEMQAVAQQDYTDAAAQARQAVASVAQQRAALDTARINLQFTTVPAPITGRIGRSLATVGALVTGSQADPMAVIQRLDPMYVDMQQSSAALLALRRSLATGGVTPASAQVRLTLEDGSDYSQPGTVEFAEAMVDQSTGTVTLRARFANPQGLLLPGMFVRARFVQSINARAFLVPQPAVARDARGTATVFIVGPGNKAIQRQITAERALGPNWVVTTGLNPGDRVITQGVANLRPNVPIQPVPANTPQHVAPPQQNSASGQAQHGGGSR